MALHKLSRFVLYFLLSRDIKKAFYSTMWLKMAFGTAGFACSWWIPWGHVHCLRKLLKLLISVKYLFLLVLLSAVEVLGVDLFTISYHSKYFQNRQHYNKSQFTEISFNLKILNILANYNHLTAILTVVLLSFYIPEMSDMKPIFL